jgi:hypothetical protein
MANASNPMLAALLQRLNPTLNPMAHLMGGMGGGMGGMANMGSLAASMLMSGGGGGGGGGGMVAGAADGGLASGASVSEQLQQLQSNNQHRQTTRDSRRIFLGNLPSGLGLSEQLLVDYLNASLPSFGVTTPLPIVSAQYREGQRFCFIEFRSVKDADSSMTTLQGTPFPPSPCWHQAVTICFPQVDTNTCFPLVFYTFVLHSAPMVIWEGPNIVSHVI